MEHYKENAYVVYIRISCEELKNRLADLHQRGVAIKPGETLEDLYSERLPLYEQYADITVDSDAGISAIAHKIKNILEKMR
jgi:shikimate kinase